MMHLPSSHRSEEADGREPARRSIRFLTSAATAFGLVAGIGFCDFASAALASSPTPLEQALRPFLADHCVKCHGPENQKGDVRLDTLNLTGDLAKDRELLTLVRDQIRDGLMPPKKEPQPAPTLALRVAAALTQALPKAQTAEQFASDQLPNRGNLIPHDLLFGQPADEVPPPAARLWRLNSDSYLGLVSSVSRARTDGLVKPFTLIPERGLKDYAALYSMDEPTTEILLRNAATVVERQTAHDFKDGKLTGKNDTIREFVALMGPAKPPTPEQFAAMVKQQFTLAIGRVPGADESSAPNSAALPTRVARRCSRPANSPPSPRAMAPWSTTPPSSSSATPATATTRNCAPGRWCSSATSAAASRSADAIWNSPATASPTTAPSAASTTPSSTPPANPAPNSASKTAR